MKNVSVYEIATQKILVLLEQGVAPWRKAWTEKMCLPAMNYATRSPYRGFNQLYLSYFYEDPYFMTFKQVQDRGGRIRKGAKAELVFFWNWLFLDAQGKKVKEEDHAAVRIPQPRAYHVFNAPDIEGIDFVYPSNELFTAHERITCCESIVEKTSANIEYTGNRACYAPALDLIRMPLLEQFTQAEEFYGTLFHELGHWTGHTSRLNRFKADQPIAAFGSDDYSREELVAELCAAFVCAHCQIDTPQLEANSAAYLQGWIAALKGDARLILSAAAQAQKAADFILGLPDSVCGSPLADQCQA